MNVFRAETGAVGLDQESANRVIFVLHFGPDDGNIGDRAGSDPHLFAVEDIFISNFAGAGSHTAWIRTKIWLGESEAAELLSFLHCRQPGLLLLVAPKRVNGIHD